MKNEHSWAQYWNQQTDARHSSNTAIFHEKLAAEIKFHLGKIEKLKILELGCGDGALITHLDIKAENYTGIDFSTSLLEIFAHRHPDFETMQIGAIEYLQGCTDQYDIIFSFGVLQYLDSAQLKALFSLQHNALTEHGSVFHFGIPAKELQHLFTSGQGVQHISNFQSRSLLKQVKSRIRNNIGHWHKLQTLYRLSTSAKYKTEIYGGINYLYRVNLIQRSQLS